ncbi:MAG: hypothetical protein V1788_02555 [Nanoarchaeota archaeon]
MKKELSRFKPYLLNLFLIWLAIIFYKTNDYYTNFLRTETQSIIFYLALAYTLFGFLYYLNYPSVKTKKSLRTSTLFMIVKIFFLPRMLNFFFSNY